MPLLFSAYATGVLVPTKADHVGYLKQQLTGHPGQLVVISGPSAGAGKGKVIRDLQELAGSKFWLSVSITTRKIRSDDIIHHTYSFVSLDEFEQSERAGELLEANGVTEGNRYGTPLGPIVEHLKAGDVVLLEIEVRGAEFVKHLLPDTLCVFITPTDGDLDANIAELRRRLVGRGTSDEASVERRLSQAADELHMAEALGFYDAWVVNASGRSEDAAREILALINSRRKS
jgi:guanylate kinase